jgi:3-dehydroquinate dehydratase-1
VGKNRPIVIRGTPVGGEGTPLVCTPLVGRTADDVLGELRNILGKQPDAIEWRADFFSGLGDTDEVLALCSTLAGAAAGIPIIFTIRSTREGGQPIPLADEQVTALCVAVCRSRTMGLIDFEISAPRAGLEKVRAAARETDTRLILSYHNFSETPDGPALDAKFAEGRDLGADVVKIAVMPRSVDDVLVLLSATSRAHQSLGLPLITMSMGGYGALTRVAGWMFGSSLTFAVGQASSAPGQLPVDDLRRVVKILSDALGK